MGVTWMDLLRDGAGATHVLLRRTRLYEYLPHPDQVAPHLDKPASRAAAPPDGGARAGHARLAAALGAHHAPAYTLVKLACLCLWHD